MDGEDLSPLFDGDEPPERPYAYGGYFNHFYVRNGDWSYVADNRGDGPRALRPHARPGRAERRRRREPRRGRGAARLAPEWIGGLPPYYEGEAVERVKR